MRNHSEYLLTCITPEMPFANTGLCKFQTEPRYKPVRSLSPTELYPSNKEFLGLPLLFLPTTNSPNNSALSKKVHLS